MLKLTFILIINICCALGCHSAPTISAPTTSTNNSIPFNPKRKLESTLQELHRSQSQNKKPILTTSRKMILNKIVDQITYIDDVRAEFENYYVITSKMILNMSSKKNGDKYLTSAEFPERVKIVSRDLREIVVAPNANYNAEGSIITSRGKGVVIEKDGQLYSTDYIEVKLGNFKSLKKVPQR